ncbi:hypothetical protein C9F11_37560 [Streptomyces sp. YIM 121038]|uniref:hypothetical protein n=1 Tax=Streptomyces sp. YIM 121038 TaxID=2136401 RepID=UPI0011651F8F|nr:hypothetical protein [Streptomyces sp. YIM 121038]QCX81095.1 hypothetical protein C9F11_37560 [Streptomyces sp. YIM 121038]
MTNQRTLNTVLVEIRTERTRQDTTFGEQNHRDGTGGPVMRARADKARAQCQHLAANGGPDWRAILLEEVYEALAEEDPARLRAELVQVAAVAVAWVQAIDRRTASAAAPVAEEQPAPAGEAPAPLTDEQLTQIDARATAATDGPWDRHPDSGRHFFANVSGPYLQGVGDLAFGAGRQAAADEEFVRHAQQDVTALVAEVRRLQHQRRYLLGQLAKRDAETGRGDQAVREFLAAGFDEAVQR